LVTTCKKCKGKGQEDMYVSSVQFFHRSVVRYSTVNW
jgi:hypothetical protein